MPMLPMPTAPACRRSIHLAAIAALALSVACTSRERHAEPATQPAHAGAEMAAATPEGRATTPQAAAQAAIDADAGAADHADLHGASTADAGAASKAEVSLEGLHRSCADGKCAAGQRCLSYFGVAGPRGPRLTSCEIPCRTDGDCPKGLRCGAVADGPHGKTCR